MNKETTIKDIAEAAGVSHSTVSRVLNGSPSISSGTRDKILKISSEMGYSVNYVARSLVNRRSDLIGVVLPSIMNPFMAELAHQIEWFSRSLNYNTLICNSNEDVELEEKAFYLLYERQVDGVVLFPVSSASVEHIYAINKKNIPILFINDPVDGAPGNHIAVNNLKGGMIGTDYLYSLGHREILYFSPEPLRTSQIRRQNGYCSACTALGLTPYLYHEIIRTKNKLLAIDTTIEDLDLGYKMAKLFFENKIYKRFSAIFSRTDMMALGILKAAYEYEVKIPNDISLIGYDDISYSSLPGIELTSIRQPIEKIAEVGINELVSIIRKQKEGNFCIYMDPELRERKTCQKILSE